MENLMEIVSMPDNIPVIGMVIALALIMYIWLVEVLKHDKMIKNGQKKDIYKEMIK